jgi:uncharacterized protein YjiK
MMHLFWTALLVFIGGNVKLPAPEKIKPTASFHIAIPEPSDIAIRPDGKSFFVVSDDGYLFEMNLDKQVIRKADFEGFDCEAVYVDSKFVYVIEEFSRKIRIFDISTLQLQRTIYLPYGGGRNKGYEAFTFNQAKQRFVLITEKDPIYLLELDADFNIVNEYQMDFLAADISSATWFDDHLWLLSDEDMMVLRLDPVTYEVLNRWKIPVINPEGIVFPDANTMWILSDDMEKIFVFRNPLHQ